MISSILKRKFQSVNFTTGTWLYFSSLSSAWYGNKRDLIFQFLLLYFRAVNSDFRSTEVVIDTTRINQHCKNSYKLPCDQAQSLRVRSIQYWTRYKARQLKDGLYQSKRKLEPPLRHTHANYCTFPFERLHKTKNRALLRMPGFQKHLGFLEPLIL